jgi:ParB family chromosome partitioning protein
MALGKGFNNSLLGDYFGSSANLHKLVEIQISDIEIGKYQTRTFFEPSSVEKLSLSIKEIGLINPISVVANRQKYILLAGETRFRACKLLGQTMILARVFENLTETQKSLLTAVENLDRQELGPIDLANTYKMLMRVHNKNEKEVAQMLGYSIQHIRNYLNLFKLIPEAQQALGNYKLTENQARLMQGKTEKQQQEILKMLLEGKSHIEIKNKFGKNTKNYSSDIKKLSKKLKATYKIEGNQDSGQIIISW